MFSEPVQSRAERRQLSREKVLAAAERLFREQGFDATTVRQIAAEAGLSAGSVMAVGDKHGLLVEIFDGWIDAVHRERDRARSEQPSADTVDDVIALIEPFVDYFALDLGLSREYAATIVRGRHDSAIFQNLGPTLIGEIQQVLSRAGHDEAHAGRAARSIYFAYLGILMTVSNGALSDDVGREQFRDVVSLIVNRPEK
ncbi:TetR family transcriptional regulator [Streptomyces sp. NTH33]|uniref:TetR/AcrR family transcriptional regulator n=1 Tax=Streptomyces sp. NTH33 TaxID=1735453 RepID=UPI000DA6F1AC|nr:TetR/AcrR family transcriptional regulator [Streptomyces sp. NTH33]PZG85516.1 TetR family transcriptional regulator [Streptomyces sp. NTH33]